MNKKILKTGLTLGSAAAIFAPIAAVVSCGSNSVGRYEASDDKKLVILSNYENRKGKNTKAWDALKEQVEEYNKLPESDRGGYEVELTYAFPISSTLSSTYESQDRNKIANMAIDYPDTMGLVGKYNQQLDLTTTNPSVNISQTFGSAFTSVNDNMGGLPSGGVYSIPITKSTDMLAVNKILMGYLIDKVGISPNPSDATTKVKEYQKAFKDANETPTKTVTNAEISAIKTHFKPKASYSAAGLVTDDILSDSAKMLDFAIEVSKAFEIKDNSDEQKKSFVMGIDSATNFIYNAINAKFGGDKSKFLFKKDSNTGFIKYQFNDTDVKNAFTEIWSKLKQAIDAGALFIGGKINGQKEYGSNFFSKNRMGVSLGSTAGYNYLTTKDITTADGKDILNLNPTDFEGLAPLHKWNGSTGESSLIQGPSLLSLHVNKNEDNATAKFINWFITKGTKTASPLISFTGKAGYIAPLKTVLQNSTNNYQDGNKIAFSELQNISKGTLKGFDNPIDDTTGQTRLAIQDAIHLQYQQQLQNSPTEDIDGIYKYIKDNFTGVFE